jgi:hypothetical protein
MDVISRPVAPRFRYRNLNGSSVMTMDGLCGWRNIAGLALALRQLPSPACSHIHGYTTCEFTSPNGGAPIRSGLAPPPRHQTETVSKSLDMIPPKWYPETKSTADVVIVLILAVVLFGAANYLGH